MQPFLAKYCANRSVKLQRPDDVVMVGMLSWLPKELSFNKSQLAAHGCHLLGIGASAAKRYGLEREASRIDGITQIGTFDYPSEESWSLSSLRARLDHLTLQVGKCRTVSRVAMRSPDRCAKLSYRLLIQLANSGSRDPRLASDLLCTFALGFLGIQLCKPCEICYRLALPFTARCPLHSRASTKSDGLQTDSKGSQNARTGRKTLEQLNWSPLSRTSASIDVPQFLHENATPSVRFLQWPVERIENVLLGLLWGVMPFKQDWLHQVHAELTRAPATSSLVGELSSDRIATIAHQLRIAIDPLEFDAWELIREIPEVEIWMTTEKTVAPGKRSGPEGVPNFV